MKAAPPQAREAIPKQDEKSSTELSSPMRPQTGPLSQTFPGGKKGRRRKEEIDVSRTQENIEKLGKVIKHLTDQIKEAESRGDSRSVDDLTFSLKNVLSAESALHASLESKETKKTTDKQDDNSARASNFGNQVVNTANTGVGIVGSLTSGNFAGAAISGIRGVSSFLHGAGKAGAQDGLGNIGKMLGVLGVAGLVGSAVLAGGNALSEKYEGALPDIERFQQKFGKNINRNSASLNSTLGLEWYNRAATVSLGTGKTTAEMIEAAEAAGRYGIRDTETALTQSRKEVMWERFTGADLSAIQNLAGTSRRYGGDHHAVSTAFAGLKASSMEKGQFDEFLHSMQRIMEDGIAKGFVRGSTEIAGNMAMLHKLSGESPVWTGEQGANRLLNMSNAVANATNLGKVEDVISFGAAQEVLAARPGEAGKRSLLETSQDGKKTGGVYTGTYVDTMQLLERGVTADLLKHQFAAVNRLEGNNTAGAIERYRQMYNLNYTGAAQVWKMQQAYLDDPGQFNAEKQAAHIKGLQEDPEYQSDSTRLQNVLTKLDTSLVNLGKSAFNVKIGGLEKIEGFVQKISQRMTESRYKASIKESAHGLFDDYFGSAERKNIKEMQEGLTAGLVGTPEEQEATVNILRTIEGLNPMQRMYANRKNTLNTITWSDPQEAWKDLQQVDFSVPVGRAIYPEYTVHRSNILGLGGKIKERELSELTLSMLGHENKGKEDMGGTFAELVAGTINSNPELIDMKGFTQQLDYIAGVFTRNAGDLATDRMLDSEEYKLMIDLFTGLIRAIEQERNTTVNLYTD